MPPAAKTPVRLYLDSSDISNLARRDGAFAETRDALLALVDEGILQTRFSFFHVIELAHTVAEAKPDALDRVQMLYRLCGAKALLHRDKLYLVEARSLVEDGDSEHRKGRQARVYVEDATWLPDWIISTAHRLAIALTRRLEREIARITKEVIDGMQLGPVARSRTELQFLPGGRPSTKILKIAKDQIDSLVETWRARLPITPKFWSDKLLIRHLQGRISERRLHEECLAAFADPRAFIEWCVDEIPDIRELPKEIRQSGLNNAQLITELRQRMTDDGELTRELTQILEPDAPDRELTEKLRSFREAQKRAVAPDMAKSRNDELNDLFQVHADQLARLGVDRTRWDASVGSSEVGTMPAFDSLLEAARARFVDDVKSGRQMSHSDAGDLLHAIYIPYVDIFRADRSFRARIDKIARRFGTELAADLKALPELVRTTAARQG